MNLQEQILGAFQVEHKEQIEGIRSILSSLRDDAAAPRDPRWDEAFRIAHTLKGGARVCALHGVEAIGHQMESLFASVREGRLAFGKPVGDAILQALDAIEDWMAALARNAAPPSSAQTLETIEQLLKQASVPGPAPAAATGHGSEPQDSREAPPLGESETVRVEIRRLDAVLSATDALLGTGADQERVADELVRMTGLVRALERECDGIRVQATKALRRIAPDPELRDVAQRLDALLQDARGLARQQRTVRGLQQRSAWNLCVARESLRRTAQQARMGAAGGLLTQLRSLARALAKDEGKEVHLEISGLDVQADRVVLQSLKDPLMHAVRNAVVHGIEPPDERVAKGKPATGRIDVTLRAHGVRLHARVQDDGRGIDHEALARAATRAGLCEEPDLDSDAGRESLRRCLFHAGLSTCETVTELAGRGMGLSVVQETLTRLHGSVSIKPAPEHGTILDIQAPLFISAERLLLVSAAGQTFALPLHAIERLLRIPPDSVQLVDGEEMTLFSGRPLRLARLAGTLGASLPASTGCKLSVAVVRATFGLIGLVVDAFLSEHEAVIRDVSGAAGATPQFTGAVVLDDGAPALLLDVERLGSLTPVSSHMPQAPQRPARTPTVLVVDDSFTTRTLEKSILEANGYCVLIAVDGVEALSTLRSSTVDVVVADVQMPRMDGLTLLRQIREDARMESLPVILVTSLDQPEDRRRGLDYGANAYVIKRAFDHEQLLGAIRRFLP